MPGTKGSHEEGVASGGPGGGGSVVPFPRSGGAGRSPENNLPAELSSFVGREREVSEVKKLLAGGATRLLTLCGPGGCGKTRLARAVAANVARDFEDGARWVGLAPLSDPELVPQAVAHALEVPEQPGASPTEALVGALRGKKMLLVLDNCEHLIEACAGFARTMLTACPRLSFLATSREALGVAGEIRWRVPSLAVPGEGLPAAEDAARYEAVALFVERARSRMSGFSLTGENASSVVEVCRKLDGIPLAIEFAAARVTALSVAQISERLEDPLKLLAVRDRTTPPRQRTLRATLRWSHDLLDEHERELFGRLSVFAGGWALEAAEAVGAQPAGGIERYEVLDLLSGLVEKSLVVAEAEEDATSLRYRMLEPVRQYARERLEERGEADAVRRLHAAWFLALIEEAESELKGVRQGAWLERLETEHDNFRAALSWALGGGEAELELRLAGALGGFWLVRSYLSEGRRWLEAGLAENGASLPASVRAKALGRAGSLAMWQDDLGSAVALLEESLGLFEELGDEPGMANSLTDLGHAVLHQEEDEEGRLKVLYAQAEALRGRFTDRWAVAELSFFMGMVALYEGEPVQATTLLGESLFLFREVGDAGGVYLCRTYLWMAALERGDRRRAAALLEEDLRQLRTLAVKPQLQILDGLQGLAVVAALDGRPARATRLWGAAEAVQEAIGVALPLWEHVPTDQEAHLIAARSQLDQAAWEAAWSEGRAMTPEQALEYALSEEQEEKEPVAPPPAPATTTPASFPSYPAGLSDREAEVLTLVAKGLTNAQVAQELFISPRTVGRHLNSVYEKLGVGSRAAATRFALEHGLL